MDKRDTGMNCYNKFPLREGDKVSFCGHEGFVAFECGTFGVEVKDGINYSTLQEFINSHPDECGMSDYSGCLNDNFISLWEIYWNFGCIEDYLWMVKVVD